MGKAISKTFIRCAYALFFWKTNLIPAGILLPRQGLTNLQKGTIQLQHVFLPSTLETDKNLKKIVPLIILCIQFNHPYAQSLLWQGISAGSAYHQAVQLLGDGSVIYAGNFQNSLDAAPLAETFSISGSNNYKGFLQHLDENGNVLFATGWTGSGTMNLQTMDMDDEGNLFLAGHFSGSIDLDPGPGNINVNSAGGFDIFILKLDSNYEVLWSQTIGGQQDQFCQNIMCDHLGNINLSGEFNAATDFDSGPGTATLASTDFHQAMYLLQLGPSGEFHWVHKLHSVELETEINTDEELRVNSLNQIIICHDFVQYLIMDDESTPLLEAPGSYQNFIMAFNSDGTRIWDHWLGGGTSASITDNRSIQLDGEDNIFICGRFASSSVEFNNDIAGPEFYNAPFSGGHLVKMDPQGNFLSCAPFYSTSIDLPAINKLAIASNGDLIVSGSTTTSIDIDPGVNQLIFPYTAGNFVVRLDSLLHPVYSFSLPGYVETFFLTDDGQAIQASATSNQYSYTIGGEQYSFTDLLPSVDGTDLLFSRVAFCVSPGCIDPVACNYDSSATCDDGNCIYVGEEDTDDDCDVDLDDLTNILNFYGCIQDCGVSDINNDGVVSVEDIMLFVSSW